MTNYDDTNRGVLFNNKDQKKSDSSPDYRGSINVGGTEFWLSAWVKNGQKGKFMSLSVKPKEARQSQPAQQPARQPSHDDFDDAPF